MMEVARTPGFASVGTQHRQGDILLVAEAKLDPDTECLPVSAGVTYDLSRPDSPSSHAHSVQRVPGVMAFRARRGDGLVDWLQVTGAPVTLTHPEHAPLTLVPGLWRVVRQREYDPVTALRIPRYD